MDSLTIDCLVAIATEYMESDITTVSTSAVLGRVMGDAVEEYFGPEDREVFRGRVKNHGRQMLHSLVEDLFDA
jgi:hypothetical protein